VYPAIFGRRNARADCTPDERDAYAVARWLVESARMMILDR
jgi:hypothetical protein